MNTPFEMQQRELLADYLQDLCCDVKNPKAVSVLVEVILRLQHDVPPRSRDTHVAEAVIDRGKERRSPVISIDDLCLNTVERTVRRGRCDIILAPMEYRVLEYLADRPRTVVSKSELLEHLYDYNRGKFSNVIEVYISGLRRKIDDHHRVKLIHTMRGHGYVIRPEADRERA